MTATKAVGDDRAPRIKPTTEEVSIYTRRESELRQRFLQGILDTTGVLDGLQTLVEMVRGFINCNVQPETPSWADQKNPIITHIRCGTIYPSKLTTASVFKEGEEVLEGEEYIARAQALNSLNACAFDFYAKPENWKYLPRDADVIVFPKTIFRDPRGGRIVRYLCRRGAKWQRDYCWVDGRFRRHRRVAVLAS